MRQIQKVDVGYISEGFQNFESCIQVQHIVGEIQKSELLELRDVNQKLVEKGQIPVKQEWALT